MQIIPGDYVYLQCNSIVYSVIPHGCVSSGRVASPLLPHFCDVFKRQWAKVATTYQETLFYKLSVARWLY